ncbi:MAG: excinuclease ABC subunit C [Sphingomonadales bacterium]|nr:excinuclease ABC subunit C [Sphingomonadales bacterium]
MTLAEFQQIAPTLPLQPGIYQYYDTNGALLYVGKAKQIRKRVSSYFSKQQDNQKTIELVKRIATIRFTIVDSEQDAFLLENSLIKEYQPRYNINLKDDKTYPFIVIRKESFARIFLTRKKIKDGSTYLGPYTSVHQLRELLEFIKQTIPLRTCSLDLSPAKIARRKYKVCLEYHLGNCKGPCEGLQSAQDYASDLQQAAHILKGELSPVIRFLEAQMKQASQQLAFEQAAHLKKKIDYLRQYRSRSVIANARTPDLDIFSISQEKKAFVNYLMLRNGAIVQSHTIEAERKLDESPEEILSFAAAMLRDRFESQAKEIVVPFAIDYPDSTVKITLPRSGDRKKLLELSQKNATYFIAEQRKRERLQLDKKIIDTDRLLLELQQDLQLSSLPLHIECFDNSNFQGSYPVSAMVCFKNAAPSKKDYRKFNIETVQGINDFASMKEAVYRRYKRQQAEQQPLPQLVIIDGGKGQLSAAMEAVTELGLQGSMTLVGLAKNQEELFFTGDSEPLRLPYQSNSLLLIRRIRDEVHRFGVNFHRKQRSKGTFKNQLQEIPGIGAQTATDLLHHFRSVNNIQKASVEELTVVAGKVKAHKIKAYFANTRS